ncbi:hypothetical protein ABGN05_21030 [Aquibium sp. LZ166]|uniref:Uncharacterized protein n=1 Tax=Aquibium pacificus TaxID=3153579 RepID=A0ABV3SMZ1_9HYPH
MGKPTLARTTALAIGEGGLGGEPFAAAETGGEGGVPASIGSAQNVAGEDASARPILAQPAPDEYPVALLARGTRFVSRQIARLMEAAERGVTLDKKEIDGLAALASMMERWETLARERAKEEEARSDEELAEAFRIIDERIIELARAEAARLVAEGAGTGTG